MKNLHYAGGSVLLSDQMCAALMDYARALAEGDRADLVSIPSISTDLNRGAAQLLIGPASQLFAVPVADIGVDLDDDEAAADMRAKTLQLGTPKPIPTSEAPEDGYGLD